MQTHPIRWCWGYLSSTLSSVYTNTPNQVVLGLSVVYVIVRLCKHTQSGGAGAICRLRYRPFMQTHPTRWCWGYLSSTLSSVYANTPNQVVLGLSVVYVIVRLCKHTQPGGAGAICRLRYRPLSTISIIYYRTSRRCLAGETFVRFNLNTNIG